MRNGYIQQHTHTHLTYTHTLTDTHATGLRVFGVLNMKLYFQLHCSRSDLSAESAFCILRRMHHRNEVEEERETERDRERQRERETETKKENVVFFCSIKTMQYSLNVLPRSHTHVNT